MTTTPEKRYTIPHVVDGSYVRQIGEPLAFHGETWVRLATRDGLRWEFSLTTGRLLPIVPDHSTDLIEPDGGLQK